MSHKAEGNEFDRIARFFAPLASANDGAMGLKDDAALFLPAAGRRVVVTADALVEGVHFPEKELVLTDPFQNRHALSVYGSADVPVQEHHADYIVTGLI